MICRPKFFQFNVLGQCREYGLSFWQCPQFLFLVMGLVIIISSLSAYFLGNRYIEDPRIVALLVIFISLILFVIAFIITQSFEKLVGVSRMKSEFVSVVSHQLRSPLSNLKWAIEILMSGRFGHTEGKEVEYLQILKENSDRMGELVSDLLTVSRIETAKIPFEKKEFSIKELVRDLVQSTIPIAQASNVKITYLPEDNLPNIFSDSSQIKQAVANLLDNAVRYIREKGEVVVKLAKKSRFIYFEIKDSGVGIPKPDQKYIFQKFFRSANALRHQTQGSGLGLYIAKAIIERAGGKIGFKSQEGQGSAFWFIIPIR